MQVDSAFMKLCGGGNPQGEEGARLQEWVSVARQCCMLKASVRNAARPQHRRNSTCEWVARPPSLEAPDGGRLCAKAGRMHCRVQLLCIQACVTYQVGHQDLRPQRQHDVFDSMIVHVRIIYVCCSIFTESLADCHDPSLGRGRKAPG
jgi:hypothetical protein